MRKAFAEQLTRLRHQAGISQKAAAADLQVSQALLSHYEKGIREPGLDFVVRAAAYYRVSTDALLGIGDDPGPRYMEAAAIRARIPDIWPEWRQPEQDLSTAFHLVLDIMVGTGDRTLFTHGVHYLADAIYEVMRHVVRDIDGYDPEFFGIPDHDFDSGVVVSDLAWVRSQIIRAADRVHAENPDLKVDPEAIRQAYPETFRAVATMMRDVGERVLARSQDNQTFDRRISRDEAENP